MHEVDRRLKKTYRNEYVIGDVQGCYRALLALLHKIDFDEQQDRLWFAGDLVARGEDSISCLRLIKKLADQGAAATVLGNHDLNLLACWRGLKKLKTKDYPENILAEPDIDTLMHWLRRQPLLVFPDQKTILTHAGIPHIWTTLEAEKYAKEVEFALSGDLAILDHFLANMYGIQPNQWSKRLLGTERLRTITNYFTRMRLITEQGILDFNFKDSLDVKLPEGYRAWFDWSSDELRPYKVLFGHWAALSGAVRNQQICALDGGCVWGGEMIAYRLSDGHCFKSNIGCG